MLSDPELDRLPAMDAPARLARLAGALGAAGCDALLVTHLTNIRYLTGFTGSAAELLVRSADALLVTDGRYAERGAQEVGRFGAVVEFAVRPDQAAQRELLASALPGGSRLGLEAEHLSWGEQRRIAGDWLPGVELVPTAGLVEGLRSRKDDGEVARIEAAASIADAALQACLALLEDRPTEAAFARALEAEVLARGAEGVSFPTIVASGPNGARPHHEPSGRVVQEGDLVVVDFGAVVEGYRSDMTRTLAVGGRAALDGQRRRLLEVVCAAQAAGLANVAGGKPAREVDEACRRVIAEAGWGEAFVHASGHGVGLDIHEQPAIGARSAASLEPGHVVTVEPGVYLPGVGGARTEDTVVVTLTGCRLLTRAPKDPQGQDLCPL